MPENPRLTFRYTQREWDLIEKRIKERGKQNLNSFLRSNIHRIGEMTDDCPKCVENCTIPTVRKTYAMPSELYEMAAKISAPLSLTVAELVEKVIIQPLLFGE
jgi:hypothetical protein